MGLDLFFSRIKNIKEVAYFRKTNFLIPFFEEMSGRRIENCTYLPIEKRWIEELMERCKKILSLVDVDKLESDDYEISKEARDTAEDLLPTQDGFFFGDTSYDCYYFIKIENVLKDCPEILEEFNLLEDSDECIAFYIWY